jgi:hypothetical protein
MNQPQASTREALELLCDPGAVYELRAFGRGTSSGYYNDFDKLAKDAAQLSGTVPAVYFTLNPVIPDLLSRAVNRLKQYVKQTTSDAQIVKRLWLPVDFDAEPAHKLGVSSTDAEHEAALDRARECREWLRLQGWPEPIYLDSGNGSHLLFRVDLPNDAAAADLLMNCLKALSLRFADEVVDVDTGNYNASRIWKCPGTMVGKGDSTAARPHRLSKILQAPASMVAVPVPALQALASQVPKQDPGGQRTYRVGGEPFDLDRWISDHGIEVRYAAPWNTGRKWVLEHCLWNPEHTDKSAFIVQFAGGAIGAGCHHNSCQGQGWPELRELFEPGYREKGPGFGGAYSPAWPITNGHHSAAEEALHGEADSEEVRLHVTSLNQVAAEQVHPLWPKRIFRGKLSVMAGDPGVGKSFASLDVAARVSLGGPWPDGSGYAPQGNVLLLSAEDGLADTVKPRLQLLGADMRRIHSLGLTVSKGAEEIGLSLQQHLPEIERFIAENDIILMAADPLLAFTGRVDTHRSAEVRGLLSPLAAMAERTGCAILAVMHPNKNSTEGNLLYRISASLDFTAAARSVMVVARHPDIPEQRVLATIKCNLTAHPEPMAFGFTHDGHFTWQGIADVDVSRLMASPVRDEDRNEREEAKDFLKTLLADGPVPATRVHQESKQLNISSRTLTRAKADLGIVSLCSGTGVEGQGMGRGKTATWSWRLPEHLPGTFKLATPPASASGQLKNLEREEGISDTKQGDIFKLATGNVKSGLEGGNVKNPPPSTESSTNPPQSFKLANPEVQDVANLKDGDDQEKDSLEF